MIFLRVKDWLKGIYGRYEGLLLGILRFIMALTAFLLIFFNIGFDARLNNPLIAVALAVVCGFLPVNVTVFFAGILVVIHTYAASMEFAVVLLVIFLVVELAYMHFAPRYGYLLLVMPIAGFLGIPCAPVLVCGLMTGPSAAVPLALGSLVYHILDYVKVYAASASGTDIENILSRYQYVIENAFNNPETYLTILTVVAVLVLVYVIRRLSVDYAWLIAAVSGAILYLVLMLVGDLVLTIEVNLVALILNVVISLLLTVLVILFVFQVDYKRTERVQFEDDEYVYYVKAVPKMTISATKRAEPVKKILTAGKNADAEKDGADPGDVEAVEELEDPDEGAESSSHVAEKLKELSEKLDR